jgi:hypothetical protein
MRTPWGTPRAVRAEQTATAEQEAGVEQLSKRESEAKDKTPASKWCPKCQSEKPTTEFVPLRSGLLSGYCRPCANAYTREYRRKNPARPGARRGAHLLRIYGITREKYNEMLAAQWGLCAICGKGESTLGGRSGRTPMVLSVDHDHHTGGVRGLLCSWRPRATSTKRRDDIKASHRSGCPGGRVCAIRRCESSLPASLSRYPYKRLLAVPLRSRDQAWPGRCYRVRSDVYRRPCGFSDVDSDWCIVPYRDLRVLMLRPTSLATIRASSWTRRRRTLDPF